MPRFLPEVPNQWLFRWVIHFGKTIIAMEYPPFVIAFPVGKG